MITGEYTGQRFNFYINTPIIEATLPFSRSRGQVAYEVYTSPGSGTKTYSTDHPEDANWFGTLYYILIAIHTTSANTPGMFYRISMRNNT